MHRDECVAKTMAEDTLEFLVALISVPLSSVFSCHFIILRCIFSVLPNYPFSVCRQGAIRWYHARLFDRVPYNFSNIYDVLSVLNLENFSFLHLCRLSLPQLALSFEFTCVVKSLNFILILSFTHPILKIRADNLHSVTCKPACLWLNLRVRPCYHDSIL